ncbi:hypothetical protein D9M68_1006300 [compost metagenome]
MTGMVKLDMPMRSVLSPYSRMEQVESWNCPVLVVPTSETPLPHCNESACIAPSTCPNSCVITGLVKPLIFGIRTRPLLPLLL